jgi:hypothetical protein
MKYKEINIIIISENKKMVYSGLKNSINLLMNIECGIFTGQKINPETIFDFLKKSDWKNYLKKSKTIENSVYGDVIIDFDKKEIINKSKYNKINLLYSTWILNSIEEQKNNKIYLLTNQTIINHLKNKRFIYYLNNKEINLKKTTNIIEYFNILENEPFLEVLVKLPEEWTYTE